MSVDRADFAAFFALMRPGQRPFAWQERLLDAVLEDGRWPDRVVAPTGAGKTAVVDIHVFANALAAAGQVPRLPRRLVLAVDRRAVVDSHDDHARAVAQMLAEGAADGLLAEMSELLRSQRLDVHGLVGAVDAPTMQQAPLVTARLRGGAPPPRSWRDAPDACAVLTGTPDMIGSRLLLQGYGSAPRSWPREAGLLAFDTALVVDEAHLSRQFLATARRVSALAASSITDGIPALQVVETTATPAAGTGAEVGVEEEDLDDPVLSRRMLTPKPVQLLPLRNWPLKGKALDDLAAQVALVLAEHGRTVGCVVNRVATAVALDDLLRKRGFAVELLVGRMRPADVTHLRQRRPGLLDATGNPDVDVLVATQTIEVGLDLDLSALVTELGPGAALAQRSGRVNRRGDRRSSRVVVAVPTDPPLTDKDCAPYAAADLAAALDWVRQRADDPSGLAPWSLRQHPAPGEALRRRLLRRLELADSWVWAATGDEPFARPDLDLWLADDLSADGELGLVSRDLPADPVRAVQILRLLPPRSHEVFPVPVGAARQLLEQMPASGPIVRWRHGDVIALGLGQDVQDLRVGDVLVVDSSVQVQRSGVVTVDPGREPAADVLEAIPPGRDGAVRAGDVVWRWGSVGDDPGDNPLPAAVCEVLAGGGEAPLGRWSRQQRRQLAGLLASAPARRVGSDELAHDVSRMQAAAVSLVRDGRVKDSAIHVVDDDDGRPALLIVTDLRRAGADEDVRQTWTPSEVAVPLQQHAANVAAAAATAARQLGLSAVAIDALRLAGQHHDDGKADPRFQVVLGRTPEDPPLAKSAARAASADEAARSASGLPLGWRHEQLSVLEVWRTVAEDQRALVARLVGTTHGHGRATFPHGARSLLGLPRDVDPPSDSRALFDEGEWEQLVQDTDEQYGVWALAFLEAVLRAADGRVSAAGS